MAKCNTKTHLESRPQMAEYMAAASAIGAAGHRDVLDWGCGYGQMTQLLADHGMTVTSFDYDPTVAESITKTFERYPGREATFSNDPVALPYADASFDAVLSTGVLEHVGHPDRSLNELHRVLRPGGIVYCYKLPNESSYLEAIARRTGRYYHGELENDRLYTLASAVELFRRCGYEVISARRANMLPLTSQGSRAASAVWRAVWAANRALARIPGPVNRLATNVELVARRA